MLPSKQALTKLIGTVYEAVGDYSCWDVFLHQLAQKTQATSAILLMLDVKHLMFSISRSWEVDPEAGPLYQKHYSALDIWAQRAVAKPAGFVCNSQALVSPAEISKTEIYNDFMVPFDIEHGLFGVVDTGNSRWASVSLYRDAASTPFDEGQGEIVRFLIPHIQRALKLHSQFAELKAHSEGVEAALNMMVTGVIFLGGRGEVRLMNRRAEEIVGRKDGLLLGQGRLSASVYAESAALRAVIAGATRTGNGMGFNTGGTVLISRKKGRPISITVAPLRGFNPTASPQPAAVLFISDPDRNLELPADLLRRCYGLTPAEARLTLVLLEGHSLKEAADSCGVTHNTAKSQLKSVFLKTDVQRQGQLIRLLLNPAAASS